MANELMNDVNKVYKLIMGIVTIIGFLFIFIYIIGPYMLWRNVADTVTRATSTARVWVVEQNIAFGDEYWSDYKSTKLLPYPFPLIDGKGTGSPVPNYYACISGIKNAEDWLLARGYKKVKLITKSDHISGYVYDNWVEKNKDFPLLLTDLMPKYFLVKPMKGTKTYSIIGLFIDFGDWDIRIAPYGYPLDDYPIDLSRFAEEDFAETGGVANTPGFPPLPQRSVEKNGGYGSHDWGRGYASNTDVEFNMADYIESVTK
jgi:hypothetical protein